MAICGGVWPATIGSVSICASRPSTASCSIAAGRRTSSEAISTFLAHALAEPARELGGGGGFAGALQADHHDGDRRRGIEVDRLAPSAPSVCDQLVVHDLHDHLAGRHRLDELDADRLLLHLLGEGARDVERDVGLEQRAADFAQRLVDVGFAQRAAPGQLVENSAQAFATVIRTKECLKHVCARGRIALSGGCLRPLKDRSAGLNVSLFREAARKLGAGCGQVKAAWPATNA